jgi:hypothetical protein
MLVRPGLIMLLNKGDTKPPGVIIHKPFVGLEEQGRLALPFFPSSMKHDSFPDPQLVLPVGVFLVG